MEQRFKVQRQSTYFSCFSALQCVAMRVAEALWSKALKSKRLVFSVKRYGDIYGCKEACCFDSFGCMLERCRALRAWI